MSGSNRSALGCNNFVGKARRLVIAGSVLAACLLAGPQGLAQDPELLAPIDGLGGVAATLSDSAGVNEASAGQWISVDPRRVESHDKCVDCHKAEFASWQASHHANETFDMLRSGDYARQSQDFCEKLDIPLATLAKSSLCVRCHATPIQNQLGENALAGVSCESCHGAAGGEAGWLNVHAVYGPSGTPRYAESSDHRQMRVARSVAAGQGRVDNPFRLAKACYECHMIWDQALVDIADHPSASARFDFITWSMGEVRHNFHMNQQDNPLISSLWSNPVVAQREVSLQNRLRLMFLSGKLAKLQIALRNRSRATSDGDFAADMEGNAEEARDTLLEYVEDFSDEDDNEDDGFDPDDLPSLQKAIRAANAAFEFLEETLDAVDDDDNIDDDDKVSEVYRRTSSAFLRAAQVVSEAGDEFCARHDGSLLEVVDDDLPVITDDDESEAHYSDAWKRRHGIKE